MYDCSKVQMYGVQIYGTPYIWTFEHLYLHSILESRCVLAFLCKVFQCNSYNLFNQDIYLKI